MKGTMVQAAACVAALIALSACGPGDTGPPPNQNTSTCYRCTFQNSAFVQQTYACSAADAQQFGRPCLR